LNYLQTEKAPQPIGPYSQATEINGFIFTSGQIAIDPATGDIVSERIEDQTRQVIKNLEAVLQSGNSSLANVVKTTIFLSNMDHFTTVNGIYGEFFNRSKPARSTVEVSRLPRNVLIEIDCIATK
jgi:2-iminobutanoate/2-iminopropanoate deaminase